MIDTVEIRYTMNADEAEMLIKNISIPINAKEHLVNKFLQPLYDGSDVTYLPVFARRNLCTVSSGLRKLQFRRYDADYYLYIMLNLEALVSGTLTNRLYVANVENNVALQDAYAKMMTSLFPVLGKGVNMYLPDAYCNLADRNNDTLAGDMKRLLFLSYSQTIRVDYSVNLNVDDKERYLSLAKRSFNERNNMRQIKFSNNNNVYAIKSRSENKHAKATMSMCIYNKSEKYCQQNICNASLISEAESVVRYEVSYRKINKWSRDRRCKFLMLSNSSPLEPISGLQPFLNEDIATRELLENYAKHIGCAEYFYNDYNFTRIIDQYDFGYTSKKTEAKYKQKLKDLAMLISQSKSVKLAKQRFVEGKAIGKSANLRSVSKSAELGSKTSIQQKKHEFDKLWEDIIKANVQPLRIPRNMHIAKLENPFSSGNIVLSGLNYKDRQFDVGMDVISKWNYSEACLWNSLLLDKQLSRIGKDEYEEILAPAHEKLELLQLEQRVLIARQERYSNILSTFLAKWEYDGKIPFSMLHKLQNAFP